MALTNVYALMRAGNIKDVRIKLYTYKESAQQIADNMNERYNTNDFYVESERIDNIKPSVITVMLDAIDS